MTHVYYCDNYMPAYIRLTGFGYSDVQKAFCAEKSGFKRKWTAEEDEYIRTHPRKTWNEIAKVLDRSYYAVKTRANEQGLRRSA